MKLVKVGPHRLYRADCLKLLPRFKTNLVNVTVTSPPYNLHKEHSSGGHSKTAKKMEEKYDAWYDDDLPEYVYQGQQRTAVEQMLRVTRSSVFYNHRVRYAWHKRNKTKTLSKIYHPLDWLSEFPIWSEIIWDRAGIGNPTGRFHNQHELIYQIGKPEMWNNTAGLTSIWKIPPSSNEGHVCTFPMRLVANCLSPTTTKGDRVLDPYAGSGTVGVHCAHQGLKFIGIERDPKLFELMVNNIEAAHAQKRLYD